MTPHDRRSPDRPDRRALSRGGRRAGELPADWLSIRAYARTYNVDRGTVQKWLGQEILEHWRVGFIVRIRNMPPDQHFRVAAG